MTKLILSFFTILLMQTAFAHEGHDLAPGMLKANHGGTVLAGKEINLEYVSSSSELKLFPVSHEGQDLTSSQVTITATVKAPKGKTESLKLESKDGAWISQLEFKKAYRLEVNVTANIDGKKDSFKFQVEK